MKILKDSTYNALLAYKARYYDLDKAYDALTDRYVKSGQEIASLKKDHAFDFIIRRAIVGKKGSGKTEIVKSMLRKMHPNRYFIIDSNSEYGNFPDASKLTRTLSDTLDGFKDKVKDAILANVGKLIVVEDFEKFFYTPNDVRRFFEIIGNSEFIIICHTSKSFYKFIDNLNLIYNTGCFETSQHEKVSKQYPNIYCDLSKKEVGRLIHS